jgi:hypothetical protein
MRRVVAEEQLLEQLEAREVHVLQDKELPPLQLRQAQAPTLPTQE